MPIRINLLAEQQAEDDARRRDPVKRAIWAGGALAALMLLWSLSLQFDLWHAKSELNQVESKLQAVEENSKEARGHWTKAGELENRIANLQRYSTNRFFCATLLDAMQQVVLDDVRLVRFQSAHTFATNALVTVKTNLTIPLPEQSRWSFWKSSTPLPDVAALVSNQIAGIKGRMESLKTPVELSIKTEIRTNRNVATAQVEITKPPTAVERVVLTITARDYGDPPGKRVDELSKVIGAHPYFGQRLLQGEGEGILLRERAIHPELDPTDPLSAGKAFVPFVIECRYHDTTRANE